MSISDIKKEAACLGSDEVAHLAAWFHHLARRKDPAYLKSLDQSFEAIEAGDGMALDDYKRLSEELHRSGM